MYLVYSNEPIQNNKPSISALESLYEHYNKYPFRVLSVGEGDSKFTFEVKYRLNASDTAALVDSVCEGVVDTETGEYHPELKDYFLRVAVLNAYTNLTLPIDDTSWNLVYGTPVFAKVVGSDRLPVGFCGWDFDDITSNIDADQYMQILIAIDQKIEYTLEKFRYEW